MPRSDLRLVPSGPDPLGRSLRSMEADLRFLAKARTGPLVANGLVEEVREAAGAACAAVYWIDQSTASMRIAACRGLSEKARRALGRLPLSTSSPLTTAARTRRASWFRSRSALLLEYPDFFAHFRDPRLQSLAVLPLEVGDCLVGVFAAGYIGPRLVGDQDLELLLVAVAVAEESLRRCPATRAPAITLPADDAKTAKFVTFSVSPPGGASRSLGRRSCGQFEVARAARRVCRRHLPAFRETGRALTCDAGRELRALGSRSWAERMLGALLALASNLVPGADVHVQVGRMETSAIVQARLPFMGPSARATRGNGTPDMARMTAAREEWERAFWLWRALARAQGVQVSLLLDRSQPTGLRISFPLCGTR